MPATPISEKDLEELSALFDSVGEDESYLTRRLRNVGRGLLALATQSQERDAELAQLRSDLATYVRSTEAVENILIDAELAANERDAEIRRAAIEECAKVADRLVRKNVIADTIGEGESGAAKYIAGAIRALATDGEVKM